METAVPKRMAATIINALKGGVVPRVGLEYITVGRAEEIDAILRDIELIEAGGATFRFIVGKYGSGKSFLLQTIRNYATGRGFAVMDADFRPSDGLPAPRGRGWPPIKSWCATFRSKQSRTGAPCR